MTADVNNLSPTAGTAALKLSSGDVADVPDVLEVFPDGFEEHGAIDVRALDVFDKLAVVTLPPIWPADTEFLRILSALLLLATDSSAAAESVMLALAVEHENDKECPKALQAKETSDLAFSKRSGSFDASKL